MPVVELFTSTSLDFHSSSMNQELLDNFKEFLKTHKMKFTPERELIFMTVLKRTDHFDADEFAANLSQKDFKASRATVYRTLDILCTMGVLRKCSFGGKQQLYENMLNKKHHDHMVCMNCDNVIEFLDNEIEARQDKICKKYGFQAKRHSLQIYGFCQICSKKMGKIKNIDAL